ncbi:class I SAM-dependent methyltransferase [candidate division WWE3 bacterium]|nr:class I SAM-dependent methyltransferase [candidate division WWE3 bacterium]
MPIREELQKVIDTVDGWLTIREAETLYNLAHKATGKGSIVEIGSWKGKSTICLGLGSKAGHKVKIVAIDPHTGSPEHKREMGDFSTFDEFKKNIQDAQISELVEPIVKPSYEAAREYNQPVEVIFIDGAHEYEAVRNDLNDWFPKIVNGGFIALHDTTSDWEGPWRVVKETGLSSQHIRNIHFIDTITVFEKVASITPLERVQNVYKVMSTDIYFTLRKIKFPQPVRNILKKVLPVLGIKF